jgi:hypothetical protein
LTDLPPHLRISFVSFLSYFASELEKRRKENISERPMNSEEDDEGEENEDDSLPEKRCTDKAVMFAFIVLFSSVILGVILALPLLNAAFPSIVEVSSSAMSEVKLEFQRMDSSRDMSGGLKSAPLMSTVSTEFFGLKVIAIYLLRDGEEDAMDSDVSLLYLSPECNGERYGCDVSETAKTKHLIKEYMDMSDPDALNRALSQRHRSLKYGKYRKLVVQICSHSPPKTQNVGFKSPEMKTPFYFRSEECLLESDLGNSFAVSGEKKAALSLEYSMADLITAYDSETNDERCTRSAPSYCTDLPRFTIKKIG